jgi:hypothetical protein
MPDQVRHDGHKLNAFLNFDTDSYAGIQLLLQDISKFPLPSARGQALRGNDILEMKKLPDYQANG